MKLYLLLIASLSLTTLSLQAQQSDSLSVDLEDIIIKENRLELPFSEASRTINIITRAEIEAAPATSVPELLQYVAGIDVRQRGVHGVQADISIRGGTFDQTLILVNGIKMSDPQTGHHSMNLPIDIENIERIEVLKGPGARVFGQNAFAGAINIITKTPKETFAKVKLQGGENGLYGVRLSGALSTGNYNQYLSLSRDASDGYKYNTDYSINNIFYQGNAKIGTQQLNVIAGFTERKFGANGFYASPDFMDQYEEVQTSLVAADMRILKGDWVIKPRLYWRRNRDEYVFLRQDPDFFRNTHFGNTIGAELNTSYSSDLGVTGIGLDVNQVSLSSNNLGERERTAVSIFLEHRFSFADNRLDVTPGVLLNSFSDFDANFLPGIDVGYNPGNGLRAYVNAGYTYRVPTFTDLYYEDRANIGNINLQPESAVTYEAGLKYQNGSVQAQASVFRRDGSDLIDWTKEADTLRWQPQNFAALNLSGFDASLTLRFNNVIRHFNLAYTYINAEILDSDVPFSRYALENLNHQLVAGTEIQITNNLFVNPRFRYLDRVTLEDYALVDLRMQWRSDRFGAFVEAMNLLDVEYKETNLVTMPGRWVRAGASFTLK
ncbi:MAG: TonB-dependent receptor [Bacteroidota bacterium]